MSQHNGSTTTAPTPMLLPLERVPTLRYVHSPRQARRLAKILVMIAIGLPFFLLFVPWQQAVSGSGRVVAFLPNERMQTINAPIDGRIVRWYVPEGQFVKKGQPIADIQDNDPDLLKRLRAERDTILHRIEVANKRREFLKELINNQISGRDKAVEAQEANVDAAKQLLTAAEESLRATDREFAFSNYDADLQKRLFEQGINAEREKIRAEMTFAKFQADISRLKAAVKQAEANVLRAVAERFKAQNDGDAAIASSKASLEQIQADIEALNQSLQQIDVRIRRQEEQFIRAPVDGYIHRVQANTGLYVNPETNTGNEFAAGQLVKAGEPLAIIVPDTDRLAVELFIDGNDLPLIVRDPETGLYPAVRLQFEGWPAIQFVGWPAAAVGTFGGRITFVDPTDNGRGKFRVLVEPELAPGDPNWPSKTFLRQGTRANGWVFLRMVPTWWELWRRLNGFPPIVAPSEPEEEKDSSGKPKLPKLGK
jgi:adhesin transport system membrane fusion protein